MRRPRCAERAGASGCTKLPPGMHPRPPVIFSALRLILFPTLFLAPLSAHDGADEMIAGLRACGLARPSHAGLRRRDGRRWDECRRPYRAATGTAVANATERVVRAVDRRMLGPWEYSRCL